MMMNAWLDDKWQFVMSLYSTLDLTEVIERFRLGVQHEMRFDSLEYHFDDLGKHMTLGLQGEHKLRYPLRAQEEELGEITLTRQSSFSPAEIDTFEEMICLLISPIRNAIAYEKALQKSLLDPLTGLANRASLQNTLARELDLGAREDRPLSILSLDIDHFKEINDGAGHLAGDFYLKVFAEQLIQICRDSDLIYRIGGEEFLIILSNTDHRGATLLAQRIIKSIADLECQYKNKKLSTTVSIGITTEIDCHDDVNQVLERVDCALYLAKHQGRNQAVHFEEQTA